MTEVLRYAAFTADGTGGNPAGVVLDATGLTEDQMLALAAEVGYSETAFVLPGSGDSHPIRYFSPRAEVAFCGHATIATAVALADRDGCGPLRFDTPAGPVAVLTEATTTGVTATLTSPPASSRPATAAEIDALLAPFGWRREQLDETWPVHVAFAGNAHPVLAVAARETLADFDYDFDALAAVMADAGWATVHVFRQRGPAEFDVRNAFPPGGVREDPATGAAAAAFGGYLRTLGRLTVGNRVVLHQGEDMGQPSRLVVAPDPDSDGVQVTGTGAPIPA
ncbi:PhzF family phenazine biosynthesis isomerase [Sporichthya brevicatena]|uniref:PhzF family phenazine biosynthesis isomerase n=1 Tax=Sporichthya brevicatena TaxID=171442 RepID=A0ABN1HAB8_9ACTN